MGLWNIKTSERVIGVTYTNLSTGAEFDCGDNRPDTPVSMILEWVMLNADPGDIVAVNDEALPLFKLRPAAA